MPVKLVMKSMVKSVEATSVERSAVEAASVKATTSMEAAASVEAASVEATASAPVTAMSRRDRRLNQTDRCQRQQRHYKSPRHASLRYMSRPPSMGHQRTGIIRRQRKPRGKLTVSRIKLRRAERTVQMESKLYVSWNVSLV
jgi:hypothetical protein